MNKIVCIALTCIGILLSVNQVFAQTDENEIGQIAFEAYATDGTLEIYLMNADGTDWVNLTNNDKDDRFPVWSPDGNQLAFVSERDGNQELYVMNSDGSNPINVTRNPSNDVSPVWSPDGNQLAFISDRSGSRDVYLIDLEINDFQLRQLTDTTTPEFLSAWSPDDNFILYETTDEHGKWFTNTIAVSGGEPTTLHYSESIAGYPHLSPNGLQVLFMDLGENDVDLYVMNIDGSGVTNLTNSEDLDLSFAWSPDSNRIAFTVREAGTTYNSNVYVMDVDGSNLISLTDFPDEGLCLGVNWSADGERLTFMRGGSGDYDIYVIDANGSNLINLTADTEEEFYRPVWRP